MGNSKPEGEYELWEARLQKLEKSKTQFEAPLGKREMTNHREQHEKRLKIK